ncbi:MAG TPA: HAMP domain-containing sensor histidine kinase, partial [Gemmatimonadaceae bacterium]
GRLHLDRQVVDLAAVTEQAIDAGRAFIESKGHRLSLTIPARPLPVDCDPTRIAQVLINLLNNAAKYTPPGGEIFVTAERSGPVIEIRVRDTGIGIPPGNITQVFDLYTRLTPANEHSPDGLGIGLALVKELVALHDGTVDCHSDGDGTGSEFVVRLPVHTTPAAEQVRS